MYKKADPSKGSEEGVFLPAPCRILQAFFMRAFYGLLELIRFCQQQAMVCFVTGNATPGGLSVMKG